METGLGTRSTIHRVSKASGGNQPHIGYSKVYEYRKDASGQSLGYTEYNFNFGQDGIVARTSPPFSNSFRPDFKIGKEKVVTVHHQDNSSLNSTENIYSDEFYYSVLNLSLEQVNNRANQYPNIYYDTSVGKYTYEFLPAAWIGFSSPTVGGSGPMPTMPSKCNDPGNECIASRFSLFSLYRTIASGNAGNVSKTTKKDFFGINIVTTQTEFSYDPNVDYLLRSTNTVDSYGDTLVTDRYYTKDFSADPIYSSMVNRNKLTDVVLSNVYKNGDKLFERKNNYNTAGLPELIENAKGAQALEPRILYRYHSNGNLKEAYQVKELTTPTGMVSSFLWGYDSQFPVARVDNATYDQILATGVVLATVNNPQVTDANMRIELQKIRTNLPNAQVTTYTYDPLTGVTSITDPGGYTSYFDYDPFNRLHYVKDAESLVQQEIRYNYQLPELTASTAASSTSVTSGATVSFTTTPGGGSGSFSYKWTASNGTTILNQATTTTGSFSVTTTTSHAPSFTLTCEVTDTQTGEKVTTSKVITVSTGFLPLKVGSILVSPTGTTNKTVGQSVQYSISVSGGSGSYRYQWSKTNTQGTINFLNNTNTLTQTVTSTDCTSYTITCVVTDLTVGTVVTKTLQISVSSGCSGGPQQ